jgi:hypothetical protein
LRRVIMLLHKKLVLASLLQIQAVEDLVLLGEAAAS